MDSLVPPKEDLKKDVQLWAEFRAGNEQAFSTIYSQHVKMLFNYGMKIFREQELVQDCIHDLFIELWDRRAYLNTTDSIKLYLFKSLKRKMIRVVSKHRKQIIENENQKEAYDFDFVASHEYILIEEQLTTEQELKLLRGLEKLPQAQKEAIFLRFYAGMSYEEIAGLMSINYQSVNNTIFRAMKVLRKELLPVYLPLFHLLNLPF